MARRLLPVSVVFGPFRNTSGDALLRYVSWDQASGARTMSRISAFKACLLLVFFAANASGGERQLFPEAIGSQRLFYDSGAAWIVSPGPIEVDAALSAADTSSVWFGIVVHNYKNVPVTVREQDISANFGASKLRVWSASELIDQQHRKGNWRKVFAGLAAGLNAYSAGQSGRYSTSGTFDGTVH